MTPSTQFKPELLAPAGGPESFRAAVANGADAVYLGVDKLNARRGAENFDLGNLSATCRYAHIRGVRVYLTVNVVILPSELADALALVDAAWAAGVDAVIVQDLGLLRVTRSLLPHVRIHSSTQLNAHNTPTLRTLAALGVSRVTLAREVSLEEIESFVSQSVVEIESFVHGALCVCYSGQCLLSSMIGGRSANRGVCAQPCRMTYELIDVTGATLSTPGAYLLSPKDLAGIAELPRLVHTGVSALKIEGRMKNPEYVALVTGTYRAALDRAAAGPESYELRDGELAVLSESFSRGFSEAYLLGERGNDMMSYQRPNNRGVFVGRVSRAVLGAATVALESQLDSADTIEFWTSAGRFAQPAGLLGYSGGEHASAPAGVQATVRVEKSVSAGDRVFRVRNAALSDAARRTFAADSDAASIPLHFSVSVVAGEPLRIGVSDSQGRGGASTGPTVEPARTKAVTAEEIAEHVGRLGGTPYRAERFDLELSPSAGVGFSALHRLRREALGAYEEGILAPWSGRELIKPRLREARRASAPRRWLDVVVEASCLETALACLEAGADRAHVATQALRPGELPDGVVPLVPRILHDHEVAAALAHAVPGRTVAVGNLGMLKPVADTGSRVESHWSLNALNPAAVDQLAELGASLVWLSPELSGRQIADIGFSTQTPLGVAVWGRQEVMVTEHCILMAAGPCDRRCGSCERRAASHTLRDRKAYEFPVVTDVAGRSHVYNSVRLDLIEAIPEIVSAGVAALRLDVQTESAADAAAAVSSVRTALKDALAGNVRGAVTRNRTTTSGQFFRGIT